MGDHLGIPIVDCFLHFWKFADECSSVASAIIHVDCIPDEETFVRKVSYFVCVDSDERLSANGKDIVVVFMM